MDRDYFEDLVDEALENLPEQFAERLDNVEIVVRSRPTRRMLREMGLAGQDTLLGLYQGVALTERTTSYSNVMPDQILIFREPILDEADALCPQDGDFDEAVRQVVRKTVLHEIGHHFGLSDEDLEQIQYG
jgi:predicted Zn-dependent protease with MMP-like domain